MVISIFGKLDVLITFEGHKYQLLYGIIAFFLAAQTGFFSPVLARNPALNVKIHSKIFLWIEKTTFFENFVF